MQRRSSKIASLAMNLGLLAILAACSGPRIMICDQAQARVALMDSGTDWSDPDAILWQWTAADSPSIPTEERAWFDHPTDAKPVLGGDFALITASGGGVALVRLDDKAAIFHARPGGNPHSAELLPDGNLVTASSTGSSLKLWTLVRQEKPLQVVPLFDAHGVCWDPENDLVWAIGHDHLVSFDYRADRADPLVEFSRHPLPDPGGHDLQRGADGQYLVLSTQHGVWEFWPENGEFYPYPGIDPALEVKSISEPVHQRRNGSPTLVVRAKQQWWTDAVDGVNPESRYLLPDGKIYKARWWFFSNSGGPGRTHFYFSFGFGGIFGLDPH
jgi:uncharacterized protein DUF6528